jgi:hypothetical protein
MVPSGERSQSKTQSATGVCDDAHAYLLSVVEEHAELRRVVDGGNVVEGVGVERVIEGHRDGALSVERVRNGELIKRVSVSERVYEGDNQ